MREFMPLCTNPIDAQYYAGNETEWMVIYKDPDNDYWLTYFSELDYGRARAVADAMNKQEKSK